MPLMITSDNRFVSQCKSSALREDTLYCSSVLHALQRWHHLILQVARQHYVWGTSPFSSECCVRRKSFVVEKVRGGLVDKWPSCFRVVRIITRKRFHQEQCQLVKLQLHPELFRLLVVYTDVIRSFANIILYADHQLFGTMWPYTGALSMEHSPRVSHNVPPRSFTCHLGLVSQRRGLSTQCPTV